MSLLDGLKNILKKPFLPALGIGLAVGTILGKKSSQNNSVFGFGFDNNGNYDGYIGSGRPHGHHKHHGYDRDYRDYKDFKEFQRFQDYKYSNRDHNRYNHCSMRDVQTRPYQMRRDWHRGPGGLAISTGGDDGNIFIRGDLSGKKITIG